jgi:tellurium resistance protein TerD
MSGKVLSDSHFVFFNNLKSPDASVEHMGDNLTGEGEGDDEQIKVNLDGVPAECGKIVFPVSIYDAEPRQQNFGQVRNAFIRIVNQADNSEIARYDLTEDAATETAMVFGEIYRSFGEWKFRAVGQGYATGLRGIAQDFGVNVG